MKIIDLLNKIANGEEVPKKIIYKDKIYNFDCADGDYFNNENSEYLLADLFERCPIQDFINDKVEIIEEEKKIPEKLSTWFSVETKQSKELNIEYANTNFENMYKKINEIIDYLKSKGE